MISDLLNLIYFYLDIDEIYKIKALNPNINLYLKHVKSPTGKEQSYLRYKKWMEHGKRYDMDWASYSGYLEVVKYFDSKNKNCSSSAIGIASSKGFLKIVKYLMAKNKPISTYAIEGASAKGNLGIVKLIDPRIRKENPLSRCSIGNLWMKHAMKNACRNGHLEVVNYLDSKGYPLSADAFDKASEENRLNVVKYLVSRNCPYSKWAIDMSSCYGHLEMVKYLISKNKQYSGNAIHFARKNGHEDIVNYLIKMREINLQDSEDYPGT